jgi:uncharacterized membrane protein (Fun14 family)
MPIEGSLIQAAKDTATQAVDKASSWFGEFRIKATEWIHELDITAVKIIEIFSYVGVGFFAGFLLRKYLRYVLLFILLFVGLIWVLEEFDLIVINWSQAQELANVAPSDTVGSLFYSYVDWVKQNILIVFSVFVGFLIGYKVG